MLRASANRAPPHGGVESEGVLSFASDDDGGNPANIAASGSEQSNTARCASSKAKQVCGQKHQ
jgi:hypothetical protein